MSQLRTPRLWVHNPDYQVDLGAIPLGTKVGVVTVLRFLAQRIEGAK